MMPTKTDPSIENKGWEYRFKKIMSNNDVYDESQNGEATKALKSFIRTELAKAKGEERERIIEFVQINQKGTFTDDGGNDCWYIDDLVNSLKEEKW